MTDLAETVARLARRVDALEAENAELREELGARPREQRFDLRGLLRLGGAAAAVGAGAVLMRPGAASATTATMSYGADNNAATSGTGLTSTNSTDTLHLSNSGSGAALNASISGTTNTNDVIHATNASTDPNSSAVYGEMTDTSATGYGVVGLGFEGAGVMGSSGGGGPGVLGIAGSAQAVIAYGPDGNSSPALEAEHDGDGIAMYAHIEKSTSAARAVYGRTIGTQNAVLRHRS
jgi:hypothetical protein